MKNICARFLFFLVATSNSYAQADTLQTELGPLIIHPVQHATLVLTAGNKGIYIDPTGGASAFTGLPAPDLIFITDIHGDHYDQKTIDSIIKPNTIVVAPKAVAEKMPAANKTRLIVLKNGDKTKQLFVAVNAVPMYNLPETDSSRHIKGRGNGYVLTIGGKQLYISGDTEDIPEMRGLKNIDVAFVCMNLPYTMDINQAAAGVLAFAPKIVYPYHHRGQDINAFRKLVNDKNQQIEVRLRNWYQNK